MCISLLFFSLIYLLGLSHRLCCVCMLVFFFSDCGWMINTLCKACFLFLLLLLFACLCYPYCVLLFLPFPPQRPQPYSSSSRQHHYVKPLFVLIRECVDPRFFLFFFVCVRAFKCLVVPIQRKEKRMACRFFLWIEKKQFFFVVCLSWGRDWGRVRKEAVERVRDEGQYVSVNGTRKQTKL